MIIFKGCGLMDPYTKVIGNKGLDKGKVCYVSRTKK